MLKSPRTFVAIVCWLAANVCLAQAPAVSHLLPGAVRPGQAIDVTFTGENLAGATGVWTNLAGTTALTPGIDQNGAMAASVTFRFTLPADAPVGIGGVRVATDKGISNLHLLMVDDFASGADNGNNHTLQTAQALTLPIGLDGACDNEAADFYKLTAAAGQRISIDVFARRLGWPTDPVIRLLDAAGRELAYSDDEPASGVDCRLSHTFAAAGDYFIELRDIRYQGSVKHRYRMRVGDFALPAVPYPLVASNQQPQVEQEPNDKPEMATACNVPGAIEGRFATEADRDYFQFTAKAGQRLIFRGQTRSQGSPADLFMRLYKPDGSLAAEAEDTGADEGVIDHAVAVDGVYRLMVEELNHHGGADLVYRVLVEPYQPGFLLAMEIEKADAPQGGVLVTKVTSARRDYNGPITLEVDSPISGFILKNNVIAEGQNEVQLNMTLPPSLAAGQWAMIGVVGQAKIGEVDVRARAANLTPLRTALSGLAYPPSGLAGNIAIGVGPVFADYFQLVAQPQAGVFAEANGSTSFKIQAVRSNGFDDKISLTVEGLPAGVVAKPAAIEKGQADVAVEVSSAQAVPAGKYKFKIVGSAGFQNQPKQVVLDQVELQVGPAAQ